MARLQACLLCLTLMACMSPVEGQVVEMEQPEVTMFSPDDTPITVTSYNRNWDVNKNVVWENCNRLNVDIQIKNLSTYPYPIPLGKLWFLKDVSIGIAETFGQEQYPVTVDFSAKMFYKGQWHELCEVIREEDCHLKDMCHKLWKLFNGTCYQELINEGFNCSCPITGKDYNFPNITVPPITIPFKIAGTFETTAILRTRGRDIACMKTKFCIEDFRFKLTL